MSSFKKTLAFFQKTWKPLVFFIIVLTLAIFPILRGNVYYADDIGRAERGYAVWANFSRYINEILSRFIHADNYLTDISPLPQILAVIIASLTCVLFLYIFIGEKIFDNKIRGWILPAITTLPLFLCPYFLECFSYKYDSVYMSLSIFFAIAPFLFWKTSNKKFISSLIIGTLGVCMTYQAAIGIIPVMIIAMFLLDWKEQNKTKQIYLKILYAFTALGATLLIFFKFLMIPRNLYVSNSLPAFNDFIPSLFAHLAEYYKLLLSDFKIWWLIIVASIFVIFIITYSIKSQKRFWQSLIISIFGIFLMLFFVYGIYSAMEKPLFATRAMYAFGTVIAIPSIFIVQNLKKIWFKIPTVILGWCFFVFAFTFGNALVAQRDYNKTQIDAVLSDINKLNLDKNTEYQISVEGYPGLSPIIEHMPSDYGVLNRLLQPTFNDGLIWTTYEIMYLNDFDNIIPSNDVTTDQSDFETLIETYNYSIKKNNKSHIHITFKP